jgi:hypothetical protein
MKPLATSLLLLLLATVHAGPAWEPKVIGNVRIEVPADCKRDVQNTPGAGGAVQSMKKYSFRNRVLDLELVFLSFLPGTGGNLDGAAANMTAQLIRTPRSTHRDETRPHASGKRSNAHR